MGVVESLDGLASGLSQRETDSSIQASSKALSVKFAERRRVTVNLRRQKSKI